MKEVLLRNLKLGATIIVYTVLAWSTFVSIGKFNELGVELRGPIYQFEEQEDLSEYAVSHVSWLGILFVIVILLVLFDESESDEETKRYCDVCGKKIKVKEKSKHIIKKDNSGSLDYCEECSKKLIKK